MKDSDVLNKHAFDPPDAPTRLSDNSWVMREQRERLLDFSQEGREQIEKTICSLRLALGEISREIKERETDRDLVAFAIKSLESTLRRP